MPRTRQNADHVEQAPDLLTIFAAAHVQDFGGEVAVQGCEPRGQFTTAFEIEGREQVEHHGCGDIQPAQLPLDIAPHDRRISEKALLLEAINSRPEPYRYN